MLKLPKPMVHAEVCGTCIHYFQHYTLDRKSFYPLWYGHCSIPRCRIKEPDQTCPRWEAREKEPVSEG